MCTHEHSHSHLRDLLEKGGKGGAAGVGAIIVIHLLCHEVPMLIIGIVAFLQGGSLL